MDFFVNFFKIFIKIISIFVYESYYHIKNQSKIILDGRLLSRILESNFGSSLLKIMKFVNFTTKSNRVFLATFDHIFVFRARIENSGPSFHVFKVYK